MKKNHRPRNHSEMPDEFIPPRLERLSGYNRVVPKKGRKRHTYLIVYKSPAGLFSAITRPSKELLYCLNQTPSIHPECFIMQCRKNGKDVLIYRWKFDKHNYRWIKELTWLRNGQDP